MNQEIIVLNKHELPQAHFKWSISLVFENKRFEINYKIWNEFYQ